jgi:hypothetical protein
MYGRKYNTAFSAGLSEDLHSVTVRTGRANLLIQSILTLFQKVSIFVRYSTLGFRTVLQRAIDAQG